MNVKYFKTIPKSLVDVEPVVQGAIVNSGLCDDIRKHIPDGADARSFEVLRDGMILIHLSAVGSSHQRGFVDAGHLEVTL